MYFLAGPLAFLIRPIYNWVENYGITLIIVTILIKIITIPLTLKSQKNMAKTQMLQPEMNKLQAKYKNDRDKLAMEMQKLYKEYDVNPMGGCLPLIIQMLILFGFIGVIYHPFEHILGMTKDEISNLAVTLGQNAKAQEMSLWGVDGVKEYLLSIGKTPINFNFFGIDLTKIPSGDIYNWTVWIFPVIATLATIWSSYVTKKQQPEKPQTNPNGEQMPDTGSTMLKVMPIMTAVFTFTMPIGMSLYWAVSTIVQVIQQIIMNDVINEKMKNQITKKQEEIREKKESRHPKKH